MLEDYQQIFTSSTRADNYNLLAFNVVCTGFPKAPLKVTYGFVVASSDSVGAPNTTSDLLDAKTLKSKTTNLLLQVVQLTTASCLRRFINNGHFQRKHPAVYESVNL